MKAKDLGKRRAVTRLMFIDHLTYEVQKTQAISGSEVDHVFRCGLRVIADVMASGNYTEIEFPDFGRFWIAVCAERKMRQPMIKGSDKIYPPWCKLIFTPSIKLRTRVKQINVNKFK